MYIRQNLYFIYPIFSTFRMLFKLMFLLDELLLNYFAQNIHEIALFLLKNCKIAQHRGLHPQTRLLPALQPQTPNGLRRLGAPPPDTRFKPPLKIPGYATAQYK